MIWNRKDPSHSNKLKIENAWTTIAEVMNASAEFCEQRWSNISHRFAKERGLPQRPSGSGSYTIIWPLYKACLFLEDVVVARKTVGNIKKNPTATATATVVSSPQEQSRVLWDVTQEILSGQTEPGSSSQPEVEDVVIEIEQPDLGSPPPFFEGSETTSDFSSRLSMLRQRIPKKRKQQEDEGAALAELSLTITSAFKDITESIDDSEKNDKDFVFGKTVEVMLKDVKGKKKKAILKAKIITMIAEATDDM